MNIESILCGSSYARSLLSEVETLYGEKLLLKVEPNLGGQLSVKPWIPFPIIFYKEENLLNEGDCVHELFHLKLIKQGCPYAILKDKNENNNWRPQIPDMLSNLFQHSLFFPELIKHNYSPYEMEEKGLENQLDVIQNNKISISQDLSFNEYLSYCISLQAVLSLVYARTILECKSAKLADRSESLFSMDNFQRQKRIGERLITIIKKHAVEDFSIYKVGIVEAIELMDQTNFIKIEAAA